MKRTIPLAVALALSISLPAWADITKTQATEIESSYNLFKFMANAMAEANGTSTLIDDAHTSIENAYKAIKYGKSTKISKKDFEKARKYLDRAMQLKVSPAVTENLGSSINNLDELLMNFE